MDLPPARPISANDERGPRIGPEVFRFGLWMTFVAYLVELLVALLYWAAVGKPLLMGAGR